jgi:S1-C subfamily serine protease
MKKRLLMFLLVFTICFSSFTGIALAAGLSNFVPVKTYTAGQFSDVSSSAWYATNVKEAYEYDLIDGKDSSHFDPNGSLTIAEAVKLAACLHSIYYNGNADINNDGASVWYAPYVDYAKQNGIIKGDFDNYNRAATRLEFADIFANAFPKEALEQINTVEDNAIPDLPLVSNKADSVYLLYRAGVLVGNDSTGIFTPNSSIARSEAAAITTRMANPSLRRSVTLINNPNGSALTAEQIASQCSPAVFYLEVYDQNGRAFASGSGFFISADGVAVTNYHVIEGASSAKVKTSDGKVYNVSGVYDYDVKRDIALLKIDGKGFSYLTSDKSTLSNGMTVYAIGSPQGYDNTISQGLISNANRVINGYSYIQISAPISHGSSGGALLNSYGKVIGITSAGVDEAQNLNFAIPISAIDSLKTTSLKPLSDIIGGTNNPTKPSVNTSSVTVNVGSTVTVNVTSSNANSDKIVFNILNNGQNYVSCSWGDWDSSYSNIPLYIKGISAGTAQISIYEADANGNKIGEAVTIKVNVKGSSITNSIYYDGYYPAIDFGEYFNVPVYTKFPSDDPGLDAMHYCYDWSDVEKVNVDNIFTAYFEKLNSVGFSLYDTYEDEDGNLMAAFVNSKYFVMLLAGPVSVNGHEFVMVSVSNM